MAAFLLPALLLLDAAGALFVNVSSREAPLPGLAIPTVSLKPVGQLPVVSCGMGGKLFQQRAPVAALVRVWLSLGGRGLDTAEIYGTEPEVPAALAAAAVPREDVFILTKLHPLLTKPNVPGGVHKAAVEDSLKQLQTSYIDLMLIHSPGSSEANLAAWQVLEEMHDEGKLRALGVSNFDVPQMEELLEKARVPIALNQRKMNVKHKDSAALEFCLLHNITYQAYGPLGEGDESIFGDETIARIAEAHGKSVAQVALKWVLQKGATLSVQSESEEHQRQDMDLFDFSLSDAEMAELDAL